LGPAGVPGGQTGAVAASCANAGLEIATPANSEVASKEVFEMRMFVPFDEP
jgi:hypothetical protein